MNRDLIRVSSCRQSESLKEEGERPERQLKENPTTFYGNFTEAATSHLNSVSYVGRFRGN